MQFEEIYKKLCDSLCVYILCLFLVKVYGNWNIVI